MRIPYAGCPLCDARDSAEVMVADCSGHELYKPPLPRTQRWLRCRACDHMYVDGYFSPEALSILFSARSRASARGMPFPKRALRHARELLQPGGLLFLSPYWGEIEHYHHFGRRRLTALLEECGFAVLRYGVSFRYRMGMELVARR